MIWTWILDDAANQAGANFWLAVVFISGILFTIGNILTSRSLGWK